MATRCRKSFPLALHDVYIAHITERGDRRRFFAILILEKFLIAIAVTNCVLYVLVNVDPMHSPKYQIIGRFILVNDKKKQQSIKVGIFVCSLCVLLASCSRLKCSASYLPIFERFLSFRVCRSLFLYCFYAFLFW